MLNFWVFFCWLFCLMGGFRASANVVLIGSRVILSFDDIEANFAPSVEESGKCGALTVAEPLNACSPLTNEIVSNTNDTRSPFLLITRGGCSFEDKVRRAQAAGFEAAIVYDNETGDLVAMAGNPIGVKINAVFVSKASGETLAKFAGAADMELWIAPSFENPSWAIIAIAFISLLALAAVLATCFFVRRHRIRRERSRAPRLREFHGISSHLVKAMPSLIFTAVLEDNCTSQMCAVCLEDYNIGEKLRILPCCHKFHAVCVDTWLTAWRTFCPVCKRDVRSSTGEPPASESTPLLSSITPSVSSSTVLSSVRPSFASSSSALQIGPTSCRFLSNSRPQSISSTFYNQHSLMSHHQLPYLSTSRSSVDLTSMSSQQSEGALNPLTSLGYTSSSPLNSRCTSQFAASPGNASSSNVGSLSHQPNTLYYSESSASLSPFASTRSLPECERNYE